METSLDIVERLRALNYADTLGPYPLTMEAADEIERLRAECKWNDQIIKEIIEMQRADNERLRAALLETDCPRPANSAPDELTVAECIKRGECGCNAGAALEPKPAYSGPGEVIDGKEVQRRIRRAPETKP